MVTLLTVDITAIAIVIVTIVINHKEKKQKEEEEEEEESFRSESFTLVIGQMLEWAWLIQTPRQVLRRLQETQPSSLAGSAPAQRNRLLTSGLGERWVEEGAGLLTAMYGRQPASLVLAMESTS